MAVALKVEKRAVRPRSIRNKLRHEGRVPAIVNGYQIESKRGGGGYIRITKIESNDKSAFLNHLKKLTGKQVSQQNAERIIAGLYDNELITLREKKLIMSAIHRDTLMMEVPYRDYIRANILQNVLAIIQYN